MDVFVDDVTSTWDQFKADAKCLRRQNSRKTAADEAGLTEEEQIALQQEMFALARANSAAVQQ